MSKDISFNDLEGTTRAGRLEPVMVVAPEALETKNLSIYKLIPKVTAEVKAVSKAHTNKQQNYKFRSIDDVYNVLNSLLGKYCIGVFPRYEIIKDETQTTAKGGLQKLVLLKGTYKFTAPDGSFEETITFGEAIDYSDKAFNKAMTAAFKYALFQTFCIPTEEDKDTELNTPNIGKPKIDKTEEQKSQDEINNINNAIIDGTKIKVINDMIDKAKPDMEKFCDKYNIKSVLELTNSQWIAAMKLLEKKISENK